MKHETDRDAAVPAPRSMRRRDGTGHLDPAYEALLSRDRVPSAPADIAFFSFRSADALAEELGEGFVGSATAGQYEGDAFDQIVIEESGGPFVESSADMEFAEGLDESNIEGGTQEPFPKT
jgi:hypothetical protein